MGEAVIAALRPLDLQSLRQVVLVNGRWTKPEHALQEGDVVALFPAVAGG